MSDIDLPEMPTLLDRRPSKETKIPGEADEAPVTDVRPSEEAGNSEAQVSQAEDIEQADLKPHPFADMFPRMMGEAFDALVTSINEDGLEEPIITYEGKILDGRNRHAACIEAGVDPEFDKYEGDDPLGFVLRKNLHRRQLQTSQRAMVAANLANMNQGERTDLEPSANLQKVSVKEAAQTLNVSPRSVETAKAVLASGNEKLIKAAESGEMSVSAAAKQITTPSAAVKILPDGEREYQKLQKLWDNTGVEGRALFMEKNPALFLGKIRPTA